MSSTNNDFIALLNLPDKGLSSAKNDLSWKMRHILLTRKVTPARWGGLFSQWLNKQDHRPDKGRSQRSSIAGNTLKALANDSITWNTWLRFLQIMAPKAVKDVQYIHWDKGVVTVHEVYLYTSDNLGIGSIEEIKRDIEYQEYGKNEELLGEDEEGS